jgi:hypothetical protein
MCWKCTWKKSLALTNSSAQWTTLSVAKQIIIDIDFPLHPIAAECTAARRFFGPLCQFDLSAQKGKSVHRTRKRKEEESSVMEGDCYASVDAKKSIESLKKN